jgi:hypothetical protein
MDAGRIKVDQMRGQFDFEIKAAKVFATCNEINRLSKPLQSRFRRLFLPAGLMSMATGAALVIIVGTITAMHSEQAFAQHGVDVDVRAEPQVTNHKLEHRPDLKDETLAHPPPETSSPAH